MPSLTTPGKILRLELENFKSYKGHQVIGPFYDFTAIIGPNGSGKSNLMDAISFVLGVRSGHLRGAQLKDLIYAFTDSERDQRGRKAFVRLVYSLSSGGELQFTRSITSSGGSEYRIDGRVVTWDQYNDRLKELGILVKARNFLVFQGDVESIASKNPKELTALLEQISGSEEHKKDYEELEEQKARAEEKSALIYQRKKAIVGERKQKKEQKEEAERHLRLQEKLKSLKKEHFLWQIYNIEKDIDKINEEIDAEKESRQELVQEQNGFEHEKREKEKEIAKYQKEMNKLERKITDKNNKLDKNQPELLKWKEEMTRIKSKMKSTQKELDKKKEEKKKHAGKVEKLKKDLQVVTRKLKDMEENEPDVGGKIQLSETELQEYYRVGDFEMHLKRNVGAINSPVPVAPPVPSEPMDQSATAVTPSSAPKPEKTSLFASASSAITSKLASLEASGANGFKLVTSPTVGSFRKGRTVKGKKQPPNCKQGDVIKEGQVIGYIDQFGTELPVKSDVAGEVLKLLFEEGEAVGYGDPLIAVLPAFHGLG